MTIEWFFRLGSLLIICLMVGLIIYTLLNRDTNYLIERLKKGYSASKRKSFFDELLELIKPLTVANLKESKNKNITKQKFIKLGISTSDNDIMDFENKRMLGFLIVTLIMSLFCFVILHFVDDFLTKLILGISIICLPALISFKLPIWTLDKKIKKKQKAFEKYFPDAIDLLCVCVEAGLSIDGAIDRVGREFGNFSIDVGNEFSRVAKDIVSGMSKQDALKGLSERVGNKDIQSFVAVIIQADKLGASISASLQISADSLRTKRKQRLEAQVASAGTKMAIPLVLCLLPATFAVILTPAIIQVVESLGKMNGFH